VRPTDSGERTRVVDHTHAGRRADSFAGTFADPFADSVADAFTERAHRDTDPSRTSHE
jgi:hypothetical protein